MTAADGTKEKPSVELAEKNDLKALADDDARDPWGFESRSPEWHATFEKKLVRKVDVRMIPLLCLMFFLNYLDRR